MRDEGLRNLRDWLSQALATRPAWLENLWQGGCLSLCKRMFPERDAYALVPVSELSTSASVADLLQSEPRIPRFGYT